MHVEAYSPSPFTAHRLLAPARCSLELRDVASVNFGVLWNALDHRIMPLPLQPTLQTEECAFVP